MYWQEIAGYQRDCVRQGKSMCINSSDIRVSENRLPGMMQQTSGKMEEYVICDDNRTSLEAVAPSRHEKANTIIVVHTCTKMHMHKGS